MSAVLVYVLWRQRRQIFGSENRETILLTYCSQRTAAFMRTPQLLNGRPWVAVFPQSPVFLQRRLFWRWVFHGGSERRSLLPMPAGILPGFRGGISSDGRRTPRVSRSWNRSIASTMRRRTTVFVIIFVSRCRCQCVQHCKFSLGIFLQQSFCPEKKIHQIIITRKNL